MDLGFLGNTFICEVTRYGEVVLKETLDQGLVNYQWMNIFMAYKLLHIDLASSHSILLFV